MYFGLTNKTSNMEHTLLKQIKSVGLQPTLHGNGFLLFNLDHDNNERIHIWSRKLANQAQKVSTQIHNHTFGFTSTVLLGQLVNRVYSVKHLHNDYTLSCTHILYEAVPVPNSTNTVLTKILLPNGKTDLVNTSTKYTEVIDFRKSYDMCPFEYHESIPLADLVVTYMVKTIRVPNFKSRVLCHFKEQPDNDFNREKLNLELAWQIAEEAFDLIY
jgi:hypothetical protein